MAEPRPFPPSPRRLALARASGLTWASPWLVGGAALAAAAGAIAVLGRAAAAQLGAWVAAACRAADGTASFASNVSVPDGTSVSASIGSLPTDAIAGSLPAGTIAGSLPAGTIAGSLPAGTIAGSLPASTIAGSLPGSRVVSSLPTRVAELALPLLAAIALAALALHVVQTRSVWLPRRRLPGAPALPAHRGTRASLDQLAAAVVGATCIAWLWSTAPSLANLVQSPHAAGLALAAFLATLAVAVVALGVLDALVRKLQLDAALMMTRDEKREDDRLSSSDPRWRAQRLAVLRGPSPQEAVARAAVVVLGDDVAVAIAWDPTRQPTPLRVASGRRARSTQLVALARRYGVPIHRDARLAARLAADGAGEGPIADPDWPALAELLAAVRRR